MKHRKIKLWKNAFTIAVVLFSSGQYLSSSAAGIYDKFIVNYAYVFDDTTKILQKDFFGKLWNDFGLTSDDEMVLSFSLNRDGSAPMHVGEGHFMSKYVQYHKGYLVEGTEYNLMGQYDVVLRAKGHVEKGMSIDVTSPMSENDALVIALAQIGATTYAWEDSTAEAVLKEVKEDTTATFYPKGKLTIRKSIVDSVYRLCWTFSVKSIDPEDVHTIVIDALTGDIVDEPLPFMEAQWSWGSVDTWYNGNQPIQTATCNLCFNYTLSGPPDRRYYGLWKPYKNAKDNDNHWSSSETQNRSIATAFWVADKTRDYYLSRHGRWGSNYAGKTVGLIGNWTGTNFSNAGFDKEDDVDDIVFFRPDLFNPVPSLDVISHEITHGFIRYHTALGLQDEMEGRAIVEGFADIFGLLVKRSVLGTNNWTFGNDMGVYFRYFNDPHADLPNASPSTYMEPGYWYNTTGEGWYRNSGILRKWFYQLTNKPNIGIEKADDIAYSTLYGWVTVGETWPILSLDSWLELEYDYGRCSNEYVQGIKSWQNVGLLQGLSLVECYVIQPHAPDVVIDSKIAVRPAVVNPHINIDHVPTGGYYSYNIPSTWTAYQAGDSLVITGVSSMASQKLYITYTAPDSTKYYGEKVIHVVSSGSPVPMNASAKVNMQAGNSENIVAYPNPADRNIELLFPKSITNGSYILTDLRGAKIISGTISGNMANINLPLLSNGLYILQIKSDNLNSAIKVQILQH